MGAVSAPVVYEPALHGCFVFCESFDRPVISLENDIFQIRMRVLLLTSDLLFGSQMPGGAGLTIFSQPSDVLGACRETAIALLVIDLTLPGLNIGEFISGLQELETPPAKTVAFGPHVQTDRLQAARDAECDEVVSRGEMHSRLPKLLVESGQFN